jgi:hypothetical protein
MCYEPVGYENRFRKLVDAVLEIILTLGKAISTLPFYAGWKSQPENAAVDSGLRSP